MLPLVKILGKLAAESLSLFVEGATETSDFINGVMFSKENLG